MQTQFAKYEFCISSFNIKAFTYLRQGNTKLRPYEATFDQLVWLFVCYAPSTNRNKPRLLPHFDLLATVGSVCTTHKAIASGWCTVHTTRAETASYSFSVASPQLCTSLNNTHSDSFPSVLICNMPSHALLSAVLACNGEQLDNKRRNFINKFQHHRRISTYMLVHGYESVAVPISTN